MYALSLAVNVTRLFVYLSLYYFVSYNGPVSCVIYLHTLSIYAHVTTFYYYDMLLYV